MSPSRLNPVLNIDREFESKIPPLTDDEYRQLEENITSEGVVLMPLVVWNNTIIDGHNRYKIAQAHPEVIFTVHEKDFDNRYEAFAWICKNQLGRRNLTPIQKKMLVGERYEAEKQVRGGDKKSEDAKSMVHFDPLNFEHGTRSKIAIETNTSEGYVQRAGEYSIGVAATEKVSPGFRQEVLSGNIKPTQKEMQAMTKGSSEERKSIIDQVFRRGRKPPNGARGKSSVNKAALADIQKISEEMARPKPSMAAKDAVQQFEWEVTRVMQGFDITFDKWPQLITEGEYHQQVIATLQDLKNYILHIEGGIRYEWDYEARKIAL